MKLVPIDLMAYTLFVIEYKKNFKQISDKMIYSLTFPKFMYLLQVSEILLLNYHYGF